MFVFRIFETVSQLNISIYINNRESITVSWLEKSFNNSFKEPTKMMNVVWKSCVRKLKGKYQSAGWYRALWRINSYIIRISTQLSILYQLIIGSAPCMPVNGSYIPRFEGALWRIIERFANTKPFALSSHCTRHKLFPQFLSKIYTMQQKDRQSKILERKIYLFKICIYSKRIYLINKKKVKNLKNKRRWKLNKQWK